MIDTLLFVSIVSLLLSIVTHAIAALVLRNTRRALNLPEHGTDHLHEEQAQLEFLHEERRDLKEALEQERQEYLEAQQGAESAERERSEELIRERDLLKEELERESAKHLEAQQQARQEREKREQEHCARKDVEQRIAQLKRELAELRTAEQNREVGQEDSSPVSARLLEDLPEPGRALWEGSLPMQRAQRVEGRSRPAGFAETTTSEPVKKPPEDKRPRLGVWHSHPDDVASRGTASVRQGNTRGEAPTKMFRKHYDKYLENYQCYVELVEELYRMRDNGEVPPHSLDEREWEKRLHRVNQGIKRTTARLDILEEHNPDLANDDRISHRASIARRHAELAGSG